MTVRHDRGSPAKAASRKARRRGPTTSEWGSSATPSTPTNANGTERSTRSLHSAGVKGCAGAGVTQGDVYTHVSESAGVATGQEFDALIAKP
jgi:hypothetical protein